MSSVDSEMLEKQVRKNEEHCGAAAAAHTLINGKLNAPFRQSFLGKRNTNKFPAKPIIAPNMSINKEAPQRKVEHLLQDLSFVKKTFSLSRQVARSGLSKI